MTYTIESALARIENGPLADIGQISADVKRELERRVRRGQLVKYRGYWDTLSPHFGLGAIKTIYAKVAA